MKFITAKILTPHLEFMENSLATKNYDHTSTVWLTAFALYNAQHSVKLDITKAEDYKTVYKYIHKKLKL